MNAQLPVSDSQPFTLFLPNSAATKQLGIELGSNLTTGSVLLLEGDLGSGKTTLVQGLGEGLGITDAIDSPTFTLVNEYLNGRIRLYHLDLYRLNSAEAADLYPETYWEGVEVEPGIVAIEWAERLLYLPTAYLRIQLFYDVQQGRRAILTSIGEPSFEGLVAAIAPTIN